MQFDNQKIRNVADAAAKILAGETVSEELKGNQHKIDKNKNNKIDAQDFKLLRKEDAEQIDEISAVNKAKPGWMLKADPELAKKFAAAKRASRPTLASPSKEYLEKMKMKKEDVEQIDEISKKLAVGYMRANTKRMASLSNPDSMEKKMKRHDAYDTATKKYHGEKGVKVKATEEVEIQEKTLTPAESKKKEEIVKSMKKDKAGFKERYGKKARSVMYATATKTAKRVAEEVETLALNAVAVKDCDLPKVTVLLVLLIPIT